MSSPRLRGIHGSEVISLGQGGVESFSIVRCRSVVLRPGDAHMYTDVLDRRQLVEVIAQLAGLLSSFYDADPFTE